MKIVTILGSTGSVGCNTLNIIDMHKTQFRVFALTANTNVEQLLLQCLHFKPKYAVILDVIKAKHLQDQLLLNNVYTKVLTTVEDLSYVSIADEVDIVVSAIVGTTGLFATYKAICHNKQVLLANKESLIVGGKLIIDALKTSNAVLIPIDSEHNAIFQCLTGNVSKITNFMDFDFNYIHKIILTASGGPFRLFEKSDIAKVTPEIALKHPIWNMGAKISIDSSTLMNKGLELIEAYWLFGQNLDLLDIVIHPQSIIHSMVEYIDGSFIAQLGMPDMRIPISYGLSYPNRICNNVQKLDFAKMKELTFEKPDLNKFPCLKLAYDSLISGGAMPAVLNIANEVAVDAFLKQQIKFYDINATIYNTMENFVSLKYSTIEELASISIEVKQFALANIKKLA